MPSSPLRVLVDASILKPRLGGIKSYTTNLVDGLAHRPDIDITALTSIPEAFKSSQCRTVPVPDSTRSFARRAVWREFELYRAVREERAEVLLVPFPELPVRRTRIPVYVLIFDVTAALVGGLGGWSRALRYWCSLKHVTGRAAGLLCPSHATVLALHTALGVDPRRCTVIGGAPQAFSQDVTPSSSPSPFPRYVLYTGELRPHKNVPTLVRALRHIGDDAGLVLVGPATLAERREISDLAGEAGVAERVAHLGFVSQPELAALYRDAALVAFPSLHEGFGMPVLEAMSCGVPVVASDIAPVREVSGDAAVLVDTPLDPQAWATSMESVLRDSEAHAALVEAGRRRCRAFSWTATADRCAHALRAAPSR